MSSGQRLREAREAAGMTLEEIATTTRIPTRHLESIEAGDFARLPAPTYTIGFAKSFAAAVGLDRTEIGDQLRTEIGGSRPVMTTPEVFEPADPARAMPIWLIVGAIVLLLVFALLYNWYNTSSLDVTDGDAAADVAAPAAQLPAPVLPQGQGPVVITANEAAWVDVRDGAVILKQGELASGQSFEVPVTAVAPTLTTAKPEALRISIGTADAPAIGEPGKKVTVSLKPDDLQRPPPAANSTVAQPAAASPTQAAPLRAAPVRRPVAAQSTPVVSPPAPAPAANATVPATQPQQ